MTNPALQDWCIQNGECSAKQTSHSCKTRTCQSPGVYPGLVSF